MIDAGDMNRRVRVMRTPTTTNGAGEDIAGTPTQVGDPSWAEVRPSGASERERFNSVPRVTTHIIRMRYRDDVLSSDFLLLGTRRFEINGWIDPEDAHVELKLFVFETTQG